MAMKSMNIQNLTTMDCIQLRQNQGIEKENGDNITNKVKLIIYYYINNLFWVQKV